VQIRQSERRDRADCHPLTTRRDARACGRREERHGVPLFDRDVKLTSRRLADGQGSTFETT
jgi:hypothetical protein